jgi:hypothetical protein
MKRFIMVSIKVQVQRSRYLFTSGPVLSSIRHSQLTSGQLTVEITLSQYTTFKDRTVQ